MIRNVWAVGRNYTEHAKELGNFASSADSDPMIFLKAGTSVVDESRPFRLPAFSQDVHHEVELALRFGRNLAFDAMALSIDLTARDLQNKLKSQGHPWTLAKSFQDATLLGAFAPVTSKIDLRNITFELRINGELRQSGNTKDMVHSAEKLRSFVLARFPVVEGDLLLTGTPAGVGPVRRGDVLEAGGSAGLLPATWRAASTPD